MNTLSVVSSSAPVDIRSVGIIGAGQMGVGIAQVCAVAGLEVWLHDTIPERIEAGVTMVANGTARMVAKQLLEEAAQHEALARLRSAPGVGALSSCDLIIEAATEIETVKRGIFESLCPVIRPEVILATNTSSISITRLASSTDRPGQFIGLHFMKPVPVMKLVEIIRGIATDEAVYQSASALVARLGKIATASEDYPAFIVNRVLLPMINEAIFTLYEG